MPPTPISRRFDVDWIRIGAFGLLIVYHVGLFYAPWDWHVHSDHVVAPLRSAVLITNPWRLSLLFLVSGVALGFMSRNRDPAAVMRARLNRLALPLLFGVIVIVPPQAWIECLDKGTWDKGYLEFWFAQFRPERWGNAFPLNHLWFVLYIGIYSLAALAIFGSPKRRAAAAGWLDHSLRDWRLLVFPMIYLAFARQMLIGWFGLTNHFPTDWYNHSVSFVVFSCGFLLCMREGVWKNFERLRWQFLGIAIVALPLLMINDAHPGGRAFFSTIRNSLMGIDAWSTIGAILGFASKHLRNADGPVRRYLTDAVFPCYIVHQTILVLCAYALKSGNLPFAVEAPLLITVTLGGSLGVYELVRRCEPIRPLFGLKPTTQKQAAAPAAADAKPAISGAVLD